MFHFLFCLFTTKSQRTDVQRFSGYGKRHQWEQGQSLSHYGSGRLPGSLDHWPRDWMVLGLIKSCIYLGTSMLARYQACEWDQCIADIMVGRSRVKTCLFRGGSFCRTVLQTIKKYGPSFQGFVCFLRLWYKVGILLLYPLPTPALQWCIILCRVTLVSEGHLESQDLQGKLYVSALQPHLPQPKPKVDPSCTTPFAANEQERYIPIPSNYCCHISLPPVKAVARFHGVFPLLPMLILLE